MPPGVGNSLDRRTQRLRLGCVVFVSTLHNPVHLAKSLASLDQLSGGRIDVGLGTGGKHRQFAAFGMSADRYVARFAEGVQLMKALWTQPRVTFDGEFWQLSDVAMEPYMDVERVLAEVKRLGS